MLFQIYSKNYTSSPENFHRAHGVYTKNVSCNNAYKSNAAQESRLYGGAANEDMFGLHPKPLIV